MWGHLQTQPYLQICDVCPEPNHLPAQIIASGMCSCACCNVNALWVCQMAAHPQTTTTPLPHPADSWPITMGAVSTNLPMRPCRAYMHEQACYLNWQCIQQRSRPSQESAHQSHRCQVLLWRS